MEDGISAKQTASNFKMLVNGREIHPSAIAYGTYEEILDQVKVKPCVKIPRLKGVIHGTIERIE